MKKLIKIILFLVFSWVGGNLYAQENCIVLKAEISGTYAGKCKDGLAHGKGRATGQDAYVGQFSKGLPHGSGTYTWANGDTYEGNWENGLRQGEGTMKFKSNGKDTTMTGLWEKDLYKGPLPPKPEVISKTNIDRYTITKSGGIRNRVLINFYQNGALNNVENLLLSTTSGYSTSMGRSVGYDNLEFPVTIKVTYTTWNKARTAQIYATFEFEIAEPGDWVVDLHN